MFQQPVSHDHHGGGLCAKAQDVEVRSVVPVSLNITLDVSAAAETVTVEAAGDLIETDSSFHTDIDKSLIDSLPWRASRRP